MLIFFPFHDEMGSFWTEHAKGNQFFYSHSPYRLSSFIYSPRPPIFSLLSTPCLGTLAVLVTGASKRCRTAYCGGCDEGSGRLVSGADVGTVPKFQALINSAQTCALCSATNTNGTYTPLLLHQLCSLRNGGCRQKRHHKFCLCGFPEVASRRRATNNA